MLMKELQARYSQTPYIKVDGEGKFIIGKNPLKAKKQDFERKRSKLARTIRKELPTDVYNISMTVLVDAYEKPGELTETDNEINSSLEDLLEGKISVKAYINTVQCYLENEEIEYSPGLVKFREQETPRVFKDQEIPKAFISPSTSMEFLLVSAGSFSMGSPSDEEGRYNDEGPIHKVTIKDPFYLGKYPVTQKQWIAVMGYNPSYFKGDDLPVESVSWKDIQEFIKKLNDREDTDKYHLPSEAEWEYACRADTTTRYSFGDEESKLNEYAWYNKNSGFETHPVGQKNPNHWNLYDMHGNVWELVQDKRHDNYEDAPSDGSAWKDESVSSRALRGGGWKSNARDCRSAARGRYLSFPDSGFGFRLLKKL